MRFAKPLSLSIIKTSSSLGLSKWVGLAATLLVALLLFLTGIRVGFTWTELEAVNSDMVQSITCWFNIPGWVDISSKIKLRGSMSNSLESFDDKLIRLLASISSKLKLGPCKSMSMSIRSDCNYIIMHVIWLIIKKKQMNKPHWVVLLLCKCLRDILNLILSKYSFETQGVAKWEKIWPSWNFILFARIKQKSLFSIFFFYTQFY